MVFFFLFVNTMYCLAFGVDQKNKALRYLGKKSDVQTILTPVTRNTVANLCFVCKLFGMTINGGDAQRRETFVWRSVLLGSLRRFYVE